MLRFVIGVPGALVIALPSAAAVQSFPAPIAAVRAFLSSK